MSLNTGASSSNGAAAAATNATTIKVTYKDSFMLLEKAELVLRSKYFKTMLDPSKHWEVSFLHALLH